MKSYTAVYIGNGSCFNLFCVFVPEVNVDCIRVLIKELNTRGWYVAVVDSDTTTPKESLVLN